jgi:hypothetical protein
MWLLHFLPDTFLQFVVNTVLITGIVGTVLFCFLLDKILRFFPPMAAYYKVLQISSVVILVAGVYFKGGYATEMLWREKVKEVEAKLAAAQVESKKENVKIVERVVKKTEVIQRQGKDIVQYVDREVIKYDNTCIIPKEFIKAHNDAATPVEVKK